MAQSRTVSGQVKESGFADHPDHKIIIERADKAVSVTLAGEVIVQSDNALILREANYPPVYYFPCDDVESQSLQPSAHTSWCPFKGAASYLSYAGHGGKTLENAIWIYEDPFEEVAGIKDYLGFIASDEGFTVSAAS